MRKSICLLFVMLISFILAPVSLAWAKETDSPYTFRLEWAVLSPEDAESLNIPTPKHPLPLAVVWLEPQEAYHTYSPQPGEGAFPTRLLVGDKNAATLRYLPGEAKPDIFDPSVIVNVYEGPTPVFAVFEQNHPLVADEISVSLLACSDVHCFPVKASIPLTLPDAWDSVATASSLPWFEKLKQSRALGLTQDSEAEIAPDTAHGATPGITTGNELGSDSATADGSLPAPLSDISTTAPPIVSAEATKAALAEAITPNLPETPAAQWYFEPKAFQESLEVSSLAKAIFFGLIAGFILNIMPCVLPVITLKISALLAFGGEPAERRQRFREHNLFFSAGILTWFVALALLFGMADMAWGQLFQNPTIIFAILLVVFCLSLAMFDVFHLPVLDLRLGVTSSNPKVQAFSTGVLATLLATPCSGPLLGGVLGWSLMQSLPVLITVFMATGVGMALPYLAMAYKPDFANRLPHPGPWMLICERILGFLLMGTCLYFLSILPTDQVLPALAVLLAAAAGAWTWGQWGSLQSLGRRCIIAVLSLTMILVTGAIAFRQPDDPVTWQAYQDTDFRKMLGKQALLVEFTADWCPTCRVLEKTVLTSENLRPLAKQYGLTLIQVDMTQHDPKAQDLLKALGSASIPLLAIFPTGDSAGQPVVLRDIYTTTQMREAIKDAMTSNKNE